SAIWNAGIGGHERYTNITEFKNSGSLIRATISKADKLKRKIDLQNKSLDELLKKAKAREEKLASIPSIIPVRIDKLSTHIKGLSGF
ncbi:MAG TPA: M23 family peptidase, partial [Saprospirales bacterium]|nr:M23 family peptidase [Saprospirales bacterium]